MAGLYKLSCRSKATAGQHDMQVWMIVHPLAPGMKDRYDPRGRSHVFLIPAKGQERIRGGPEQQVIQELLILQKKAVQFVRNCKDHMVIGDQGDQFTVAFHDPLVFKRCLAGGAVPVIAGACMYPGVSAVRTDGHVVSKLSGLAVLYTSGSFRLFVRNRMRGCIRSKVFSPVEGAILQVIRTPYAPSVADPECKVDFRTGQGFMAECFFYGNDIGTCFIKMETERMTGTVEDETTA